MKPSLAEKRAREVKSAPATKPTVLARLSMLSASPWSKGMPPPPPPPAGGVPPPAPAPARRAPAAPPGTKDKRMRLSGWKHAEGGAAAAPVKTAPGRRDAAAAPAPARKATG